MTTQAEEPRARPIEWVCEELERAGVKRPNWTKAFLLGYLIGGLPNTLDEKAVRFTVNSMFPPKKKTPPKTAVD